MVKCGVFFFFFAVRTESFNVIWTNFSCEGLMQFLTIMGHIFSSISNNLFLSWHVISPWRQQPIVASHVVTACSYCNLDFCQPTLQSCTKSVTATSKIHTQKKNAEQIEWPALRNYNQIRTWQQLKEIYKFTILRVLHLYFTVSNPTPQASKCAITTWQHRAQVYYYPPVLCIWD
jgi:hypothetical protein